MMPYTCEKILPDAILSQINQLYAVFEGNDWATTYINHHKFRCYDDFLNVQNLGKSLKILNVGAAPYIFESFFLKGGQSISSIDLNPDRHQKQIKEMNLDVFKCNIECSESRKNLDISGYNIICLCEVFEHMRIDLIGLLTFLYKNMDPGSYLYMTTPNYFFARNYIQRTLFGRSGPPLVKEWSKLTNLGHMGHVREYSKKELIEIFSFVGFELYDLKLRNRSVKIDIGKGIKPFLYSSLCKFLSTRFNLFGEEFVFVFKK